MYIIICWCCAFSGSTMSTSLLSTPQAIIFYFGFAVLHRHHKRWLFGCDQWSWFDLLIIGLAGFLLSRGELDWYLFLSSIILPHIIFYSWINGVGHCKSCLNCWMISNLSSSAYFDGLATLLYPHCLIKVYVYRTWCEVWFVIRVRETFLVQMSLNCTGHLGI